MSRAAGVPDENQKPAASLSWDQVLAWRLTRQHLDQRAEREAALDVVGDLCGLHAQLLSSAELALWARVEDLQPATVEQTLWEERALVKTWAVRGTLHLLPAAEYPLWQAALGTYRHYLKGSWLRHFGFTRDELEETMVAISEALHGEILTREELAEEVAAITGRDASKEKLLDSWGATLKPAAFQGRLIYAPGEEQRVRFTHPETWLGEWPGVDPDEATQALTRRYLSAFGPATRERYARWAGLTAAQAGRRIDALEDEVVQVDLAGSRAWLLEQDVTDVLEAGAPSSVRLLPLFDQFTVTAERDEPEIVPEPFQERVYRSNGWISAVLLVDGRINGVWEFDQNQDKIEIQIATFGELSPGVQEATTVEAEGLARFLGSKLDLRWDDAS